MNGSRFTALVIIYGAVGQSEAERVVETLREASGVEEPQCLVTAELTTFTFTVRASRLTDAIDAASILAKSLTPMRKVGSEAPGVGMMLRPAGELDRPAEWSAARKSGELAAAGVGGRHLQ